jgi:hypothetical protein
MGSQRTRLQVARQFRVSTQLLVESEMRRKFSVFSQDNGHSVVRPNLATRPGSNSIGVALRSAQLDSVDCSGARRNCAFSAMETWKLAGASTADLRLHINGDWYTLKILPRFSIPGATV